jgi:hypothetical protein
MCHVASGMWPKGGHGKELINDKCVSSTEELIQAQM